MKPLIIRFNSSLTAFEPFSKSRFILHLSSKCRQREKKNKKTWDPNKRRSHLGQGDSDGSRPAANIQHRAVLVQLRPLPDSRVEHLCSSCVHLQREHTRTHAGLSARTWFRIIPRTISCVKSSLLTWKKEWGEILNFRPSSSSWMQPSPATSSHGKSSRLGDVLESREKIHFKPFLLWKVETRQALRVVCSPLTLSHKIQRGHSAVSALSLCEVRPHGALQGTHFLLIQFLFRMDELSTLTQSREVTRLERENGSSPVGGRRPWPWPV